MLPMLYNGQIIDTPEYVVYLAREQRLKLTQSEKLLWSRLRNKQLHGYRFRCQHPIYRYILDFYCHKAMIAIEIDGGIHQHQKSYDKYRDDFLASIGIITLRFSDKEVLNNTDNVIDQIGEKLLKQQI